MQTSFRFFILCAAGLALASLAALRPAPALAAGVVTNCTTYGPGPGTLEAAIETDGLVTFACSGTIVLPNQIAMGNDRRLTIDGSGQSVTLSGDNRTRLFNLGRGASLSLNHITLAFGNARDGGGGAIMSGGLLTITHSALISNTASYGGALELFNGEAFIRNSTLVGNQALGEADDTGGGAINQYFSGREDDGDSPYEQPYVEIVNSTIAGNSAVRADRAGIWQENGKLLIYYSIIADNGGSNCLIDPPDIGRQFATTGSLDDDGSCRSAQQVDPQFGPLGSYGGSPPSFALLPGSPAIDAAPADACTGAVDQRNILRPRDGNHDGTPACDLGAYEYADRYLVAAASADGLEGYWKFDEGAGETAMDSSGHGLAGAIFGGGAFTSDHPTLLFSAPYALQARAAGGASAGVQVADAAALNPPGQLTVAAWVRLDRSEGVQPVAAKLDEGQGRGYGLFVRGGELSAEVVDEAGVRHVITGEITAGGWLHVAMTYRQGGAMAAYVNGRRTGVQPAPDGLSSAAVPLVMAVDGALDDVRIYSRELSPGAVAALAGGRHCVTTGATWADAMPDLQCALAEAAAGAEVWVASGVYRPTYGPDRTATFAVPDGVGVYGGFAGGESQRDGRLPQTAPPVLSGDIQADDPVDAAGLLLDPSAVVGGNAFHVVSISSTLTSTVLERVTISAGQADAAPGATCGFACGGGLYLQGGAPQISGVRLVGNSAGVWGGAIYSEQSSALVVSATVHANRAGSGGGILWLGGAPVLANSLVAGNLAAGEGGGVYSLNSSLRLVNSTVAANRAGGRGGGLLFTGGAATAANLVIGANYAPSDAEAGGDGASIQASLVQGGCPATIACVDVLGGDPLFVTVESAGAPSAGGDYRLLPTSPAIDGGDNNASLNPGAPQGTTVSSLVADLGGGPRIVPVLALPPRIDQGAYEAANAPPVFLTAPVTSGYTTVPYTYQAVAVDPNFPSIRLPIEAGPLPEWLRLESQMDGSALLHGTPGAIWYGYYPVVLRSTDTLGAATDQAFTIYIQQRIYPMYLPFLSRRMK